MKVLVLGHPLVVSANRAIWSMLGRHEHIQVDLVVPSLWKSNLIKNLAFCPDAETDNNICLLYTSPSPRDGLLSRMPSSA